MNRARADSRIESSSDGGPTLPWPTVNLAFEWRYVGTGRETVQCTAPLRATPSRTSRAPPRAGSAGRCRNRSSSGADGVAPSSPSSAAIRPSTEANLNAVGRAEQDDDARRLGHPVDDEVAVRRQRVQAGLRVDLGCRARAGRWRPRKARRRASAPSSRSNVRVVRRRRLAAAVLGGLRAGLAVGREAVEGRVVHPDPDREAVRRERAPGPARRST